MSSNTEPSTEPAAAEAEAEGSTASPALSTPSLPSPPEEPALSAAPAVTPPTKTVESVRRKVMDVAVHAGSRVISGVWLYFEKFDKPVNRRGQNTQCQVKNDKGKIGGSLYKHTSGNGTRPLVL